MKKSKSLCLLLAMVLFVLNIGAASVKASGIVDLYDSQDPFPLYLAGQQTAYSPNHYYPYFNNRGAASIYVRLRNNDNYAEIAVTLWDANNGSLVETVVSSDKSVYADFNNLDVDGEYYVQFTNRSYTSVDLDATVY